MFVKPLKIMLANKFAIYRYIGRRISEAESRLLAVKPPDVFTRVPKQFRGRGWKGTYSAASFFVFFLPGVLALHKSFMWLLFMLQQQNAELSCSIIYHCCMKSYLTSTLPMRYCYLKR